MKVRIDFVTNSSNSSFIVARKSELTAAQKDAIIKFVENEFLGEKILSPKSSNETIQETIKKIYLMDENESNVRDKLSNGFDIYSGDVDFDEAEYRLAAIYQKLWEILAKSENENFVEIETSLEY